MTTVNVSPQTSKPTHSFGLSTAGDIMGFTLENGEQSLVETPMSPPPSPFQYKQSTWDGGRGNQRAIDDQTAFYDSGNMHTLTSQNLLPALQWGHATGLINSDEYNPRNRNVSWIKAFSTNQYIATLFSASASYSAARVYLWIKKYGSPGDLTAEIWSNNAGAPFALLTSATLTASSITDVLSIWNMFPVTSQALVSGTAYWVVLHAASADTTLDHWEIGVNSAGSPTSKISSNGSSWSAVTWSMFFRVAPVVIRVLAAYPFLYYGAQFVCLKYASGANSKVFINGDLGKASAGSGTTITKTASGGLNWATNQLAGAVIRFVGGTGAGSAARTIASNTSGTTPVITVSPAFDITPNATTIFIIYSTAIWNEVTSPATGLGAVWSTPVNAGQTVYFPQGRAAAIRSMYLDETTGAYVWGADSTNKAEFLRPLNDQLWSTSVDRTNQKWTTSYAPFATTKGTTLVYVGSYSLGSLDYAVTSMCDYNNAMYYLKADGVYTVVNGRATRINYGGDSIPDSRNGSVSLSYQDALWFSFLHSFERMTNRTVDDIGWWKNEGMPEGRDGFASCATTYLSWVLVGVNATNSGTSSVLAWNGRGWHEIFRAFGDGYRVTGISLQPCEERRPTLWVFVENEAFYINYPINSVNPQHDSGMFYMHEGYITTATIDLGKINFSKIFRNLLLQMQGVGDSAYIAVDYQVDDLVGTTTWYPLDGGAQFRKPPIDYADANLGSKSMIRLRFRFNTENSSIPAVLYELQLNGTYMEPPRYQWNATCSIKTTKANDFTGDQVINWLQDAAQYLRLLEVHSTSNSFHGKRVYVGQPTKIIESKNFLTKKWTGRVVFTIREA